MVVGVVGVGAVGAEAGPVVSVVGSVTGAEVGVVVNFGVMFVVVATEVVLAIGTLVLLGGKVSLVKSMLLLDEAQDASKQVTAINWIRKWLGFCTNP
ncbi:MAG: hypothetical protein KTU85_02005 [Acidimicrobiia bacterium]|nr:hypothetical protein [Acidimicrobiia bacterium]MCY4456685.1 hypothetical protein [Acidimicrobiaceae bacterium]